RRVERAPRPDPLWSVPGAEPGEHERDARRIQAVLEALDVANPIVRAGGEGPDLARLARLTAFTDFTSTYLGIARGGAQVPPWPRLARLTAFTAFTSTYLGIARGVDPTPIHTLDQVKSTLA